MSCGCLEDVEKQWCKTSEYRVWCSKAGSWAEPGCFQAQYVLLTVSEELQLLSSLRTNKPRCGTSFIRARKQHCAVVTSQYSAKIPFVGQLYLTSEKIRSEI